jgi:uncharacterized membrane protein
MENKAKYLAVAGIIAAIYVVLVQVFAFMGFGPIQFRVAEALTIMPYFTQAAIPGLFIGCLIANLLGGAMMADVVFGSLTTLAAAFLSYKLRKKRFLVGLPPVVLNAIVVPFILKYSYGVPEGIPFMMLTILAGQAIAIYGLGTTLLLALEPLKNRLFK